VCLIEFWLNGSVKTKNKNKDRGRGSNVNVSFWYFDKFVNYLTFRFQRGRNLYSTSSHLYIYRLVNLFCIVRCTWRVPALADYTTIEFTEVYTFVNIECVSRVYWADIYAKCCVHNIGHGLGYCSLLLMSNETKRFMKTMYSNSRKYSMIIVKAKTSGS